MDKITWDGGSVELLVERAERLLQSDRRAILGLAGAPASGKSTLAAMLMTELHDRHPGAAVLVGMDAFHLGHRVLLDRGLVDVKGAPHTFDVDGYLALLSRVRDSSSTVYAPEFHREIEDSIAAEVEIPPTVRLVVTEGNYLLLRSSPWNQVRALVDEAWFIHLDDIEREQRMISRHVSFGHSLVDATERTRGSDGTNARLINAHQNDPDLWVELLVPSR